MVDRPPGQRRKDARRRTDLGLAQFVGIGEYRVGCGDVKRVVVPRYPERRHQTGEQVAALIDCAVAVGILQQCDEIGFLVAIRAAGSHRHDETANDVLGSIERLAGRRLGLHHKDVAVGQRVDRSRICKIGGIG